MADAPKSTGTTFEDIVFVLFAIILVGQAFERVPEILRDRLGVEVGEQKMLVSSAGVQSFTPLGTKVSIPNGAAFFTQAGEQGIQQGTFLPGTSVKLVTGPEEVDGTTWWFVQEDGIDKEGWVRAGVFVVEDVGGIGPTTKLGSSARVLLDTSAWKEPGSMEEIAQLSQGDWGVLTKGPKTERGARWWFFDEDDSSDEGWVPESALLLASDTGWKEGVLVQGIHTTNIFKRAGGGEILGFLEQEEKARVLGGPIEVGGAFWWLVYTDKQIEGWVEETALTDAGVRGWVKWTLTILMIVGSVLTLGLLAGIVYVTVRTNQIRIREKRKIFESIPKDVIPHTNERWEKVLLHVTSENPSDWRLAIIEADIILDELLTKIGYHEQMLGDKLKRIARGDLKSVDKAWEAHKIRNQIAHEGGDFILTQRQAKRVINMYTEVFTELKFL